MMKKLIISICLLMGVSLVQAQTTDPSKRTVLEAFTDTLQELSASYFAYHRMWDDLDIPTPRVKLKADYHKLIVPPTYYYAPIQQALELDWEPSNKLGMDAVDSLNAVKKSAEQQYELPKLTKSVEVDRWVNGILLNVYLKYPNIVKGNESSFADMKVLSDAHTIVTPRKEDIVSFVVPEKEKTNAETELVILKPNFWKYTAAASMQFSQHGISDNWYQGGESTNALNSEFRMTANYNDKQKVQFENSLEIKLGFITAPSDTVHNYKTNADLFRINSKLGIRAIKNLYYTLSGEFQTQFFSNYKTNTNDLISTFFSPANLKLSLGLDYKQNKNKYNLSILGNPFSWRYVYLANDKIVNPSQFNVETGKRRASLFGSEITANVTWKIRDNLTYRTKFDYFTTYEKVIMNWENTFEFKFNRYLSTKVFLHGRFDDGVTLTETNRTYFQFKEMLTFGLSYTIW
ncbi:MAG: DUF3078 domain-containing protein [Bacteroidaceae bacterium]|nr:DUF3078 domain-containing protein [Bacteroidaceae bacterium]